MTTTKTSSHLVKADHGVERIANIICPDGQRRTMFVNGTTETGNKRGYVQVKGISVAGYAKAAGNGFKFLPHIDSKNICLIRPEALALKSNVRLSDGRTGYVVAVGWNYLTPTYTVAIQVDAAEVTPL